MNVTLRETRIESPGQQHLGFVDCDVHPFFRTPADFDPFLSARWREHRVTIGNRSRQPLHKGSLYPRMSPGNGMRMDAWPKDGGPPGSDLSMMREQLLDLFDVRYGLLAPLVGGAAVIASQRTLQSDPAQNGARTILNLQEVGDTRYFDAAGFAGKTVGLNPP